MHFAAEELDMRCDALIYTSSDPIHHQGIAIITHALEEKNCKGANHKAALETLDCDWLGSLPSPDKWEIDTA